MTRANLLRIIEFGDAACAALRAFRDAAREQGLDAILLDDAMRAVVRYDEELAPHALGVCRAELAAR